jgi:hypothetical protein
MTRTLVLLLCAAGAAACGPVDLEVITVPDAGAFQPPPGPPCTASDECLAGQLCEKAACGDGLGRCVVRPTVCDGETRPSCGCDGVTYLNDCLRRAAGVESIAERGPCQVLARSCDVGTPCPGGAFCARLFPPNQCGFPAAGTCWVAPEVCQGEQREHFLACGTASPCLDLCQAVRAEVPLARFPGACP